jgi:hypothetical protein
MINPEPLCVAFCSLVLYLSARTVMLGVTTRRSVYIGLFAGLAMLSKVSAVAVLPAVGLSYLVWLREEGLGRLTLQLGLCALAFLLVCGWWMLRNWIVYADPLASRCIIMSDPHDLVRKAVRTPAQMVRAMALVWATFWAAIGQLAVYLPLPFYILWATLSLAAIISTIAWLKKKTTGSGGILEEGSQLRRQKAAVLTLLAALAVVFLLVCWYQTKLESCQGRYLYVAIVPFCLMMAVPVLVLRGATLRRGLVQMLICFYVLSQVACLGLFVIPAYY